MQRKQAIIIGDSSHNTLSAVRSLGKAKVPFSIILIGKEDSCFVGKSRYIHPETLYRIDDLSRLETILNSFETGTIICTFDAAAEWVDAHESELSKRFVTPCRGSRIGNLFNKDAQCRLAEECGLTVPRSRIFNRGEELKGFDFPVLIKPLYSTQGEKSDIHICHNADDLKTALNAASDCTRFIAQEFIDKEYELNCLGLSSDNDVIIAGGIQKHRHYPLTIGACSFGTFRPFNKLDIKIDGVKRFLQESKFRGPFSIEFLHSKGKNYFLEVNFRNDGLAQAATDAGANLHALYVTGDKIFRKPAKRLHIMNYSIDYLHVKEGRITKREWWRDFLRTRCFINVSLSDPMPTISYYLAKFRR